MRILLQFLLDLLNILQRMFNNLIKFFLHLTNNTLWINMFLFHLIYCILVCHYTYRVILLNCACSSKRILILAQICSHFFCNSVEVLLSMRTDLCAGTRTNMLLYASPILAKQLKSLDKFFVFFRGPSTLILHSIQYE